MNQLISVIVPVYNSGEYLERCIESLLKQVYQPLEILIVDDGSTDVNTKTLCDELADKHASISTYHKENGGSASARNYGIKKAIGEFVGFVDSDDVVEPTMYSTLYREMIEHNVKVVIGNISTEENGRTIDGREVLPAGQYSNVELLHYFFLGHWHSACTNLYERSLFDDTLFPEGEVNEDFLLNYLIFKEQNSVYYDDRVFYHYLRRPGSNTSSPVSLRFADWIKHTEKVLSEYGSHQYLSKEAQYQYLFSNIVLGNKCLLTMTHNTSEEANRLYDIVTNNLKKNRNQVLNNPFLTTRCRCFGIMLAYFPRIYMSLALLFLKLRRSL